MISKEETEELDATIFKDCPKYEEPILGWFPLLGVWEICQKRTSYWGQVQIVEYVDQWNNEPFETADGDIDVPTSFTTLPEPPK